MKVNTNQFISMLAKAIKGVGKNKLIPLTSMLDIRCENNYLQLGATDGSNYFYVYGECEDADDFSEVVVSADKLATLIARTTSEYVTLVVNDNVLEVRGNGKYLIELPIDENGYSIKFPIHTFKNAIEAGTISIDDIKTVASSLSSALATTLENPCYCNYYFGDNVFSTDRLKIAAFAKSVFGSAEVLLSPEVISFLTLNNSDFSYTIYSDNVITFQSDTMLVYSRLAEGIDDYAVEAITTLVNEEFPYSCQIKKDELLNALNRLSLFVDAYEQNALELSFYNDKLNISSKKKSGYEEVRYDDNFYVSNIEFNCTIDITLFINQLKSYANDIVTIEFGKDMSIKLVDDKNGITQIISLLNN